MQLDEDRDFLRRCNIGGEFMSPELQARVKAIAAYRWTNQNGEDSPFLSDDEVDNLNIAKAPSPTKSARSSTTTSSPPSRCWKPLPWPKHLQNVPEFAGGHHERMDGKGYPRGLTREQMSVQARIMGIADIFEALTAKDRPYKEGKKLSEALTILGRMKQDQHVDPDLFDVFVRHKVYLRYAQEFLDPRQVDEVDEAKIPGYTP